VNLRPFREAIERIDARLLRLLNLRAVQVDSIHAQKRSAGVPLYDRERTLEILAKLAARNRGPLSNAEVERIFTLLLHVFAVERPQGPFVPARIAAGPTAPPERFEPWAALLARCGLASLLLGADAGKEALHVARESCDAAGLRLVVEVETAAQVEAAGKADVLAVERSKAQAPEMRGALAAVSHEAIWIHARAGREADGTLRLPDCMPRPFLVDPGTDLRAALAALAAGADGLLLHIAGEPGGRISPKETEIAWLVRAGGWIRAALGREER